MRFLTTSLCFMLALAVTLSVSADEPKGKKKEKKAPSPSARFVAKLELTDAQKEQTAAVDKEFAPKLAEINKSRMEILTDEQKQADPFALYAECGAIFPQDDGDEFLSLCLRAKPDYATEIRSLFVRESQPRYVVIDAIGGGVQKTLETGFRNRGLAVLDFSHIRLVRPFASAGTQPRPAVCQIRNSPSVQVRM